MESAIPRTSTAFYLAKLRAPSASGPPSVTILISIFDISKPVLSRAHAGEQNRTTGAKLHLLRRDTVLRRANEGKALVKVTNNVRHVFNGNKAPDSSTTESDDSQAAIRWGLWMEGICMLATSFRTVLIHPE